MPTTTDARTPSLTGRMEISHGRRRRRCNERALPRTFSPSSSTMVPRSSAALIFLVLFSCSISLTNALMTPAHSWLWPIQQVKTPSSTSISSQRPPLFHHIVTGSHRAQAVQCKAAPSNGGAPNNPKAKAKKNQRSPKPSRFQQAVYTESKGRSRINPKKKNGGVASANLKTDKAWKTQSKSIEELEAALSRRWGTNLQEWTAQDKDYDDDDDDDDEWVQDYVLSRRKGGARPVQDPWEVGTLKPDDTPTRSLNQKRPLHRLDVTDLIQEEPVGGRGTMDRSSSNANEGGFFFRPPSAQSTATVSDPTSKDESKSTKSKRDGDDDKERSAKPAPLQPLRDTDGKPMFLTTEQAERNFEAILQSESNTVNIDADLTESETLSDGETEPSSLSSVIEWTDLGITSEILLENLKQMDCSNPLDVQKKACPSAREGKDVLVGTYTGSGKTLAFLVPIVDRLLSDEERGSGSKKAVQALIVAPGRELASQIVSVARELLQGTDLKVLLSIGGTTLSNNVEQIRKRKPAILVGTPGRLAELFVGVGDKRPRIKIQPQTLVLDEFDALLQYKAHRDPTRALVESLKRKQRDELQCILCSATASDMIQSSFVKTDILRPDFATAMTDQQDALVTTGKLDNGSTRVSRTVIHGVVHVPHRRMALETLRRILHTDPLPQQILVFVENSRKVQIVVEKLEGMGIIAAPLHGGANSDKTDRAQVSQALREGYVGLVVATELAARGLDAPLLTHVINLDLPTDASHYAHRAGRCGRGGRPGVVINVTTDAKERNVPKKLTDRLGVDLYTVEVRSGRLNIVDPDSNDGLTDR